MSVNRRIINLVPKIIDQSGLFMNEIKNRIKLNNIFNEFEHKATNELNFYIDDSNFRYDKIKCGYNLDNLISATKQKSVNHANKIMKDNFYFNNDINTEKNKMKLKNTSKIYHKIKTNIKQIKNISNSDGNISNVISQDVSSKVNCHKNEITTVPTPTNFRGENLEKDKMDLKNFLSNEDKLIHDSVNEYQDSLNKIYEQYEKDKLNIETQKIKAFKGSEEEMENGLKFKKLNIKLPKIQLLNYLKARPMKKTNNDPNLRKVDIFKLLPYSNKGKDFSIKTTKLKTKSLPYITECNNFEEKNDISNIKNIENTSSVVAISANKELNMKNFFDKRQKLIEEVLRVDEMPLVNYYEKIIKNKADKFKKQRNKSNMVLSKEQRYKFLSIKDKTNVEISENISLLNKFEKGLFQNE